MGLSESSNNPMGNFDADKGLESGLSVPIFQYFRFHNSLMCHYCTPGLLATDIHIQILIFLTRELSEPLWM